MTFTISSSQIINSLVLHNFVMTVVLWNKPLLSSCNKNDDVSFCDSLSDHSRDPYTYVPCM